MIVNQAWASISLMTRKGTEMASINELVRENKGNMEAGIAWVAYWKNGRSWNAEVFHPADGGLESHDLIFDAYDMARMEQIIKEDWQAVILNGYYTNCGVSEEEPNSVSTIVDGVKWNYRNGYNMLSDFFNMVFDNAVEQEAANQ